MKRKYICFAFRSIDEIAKINGFDSKIRMMTCENTRTIFVFVLPIVCHAHTARFTVQYSVLTIFNSYINDLHKILNLNYVK